MQNSVHRLRYGAALFVLLGVMSGCATAPTTPVEQPAVTALPKTPTVVAEPITTERLTVVGVGDIMLAGTAGPELQKYGYDYPFEKTKPVLSSADVVLGNLEGPLTTRGEATQAKEYVFRSPPDKVAQALKRANFTALSLANNHTLDFGAEGLEDTIAALDRAGLKHAGAGANLKAARTPAVMTVKGQRVAFLAYSLTFPESFWATYDKPGTAFGHETHVRADVAAARERADIVIVSFHWGAEHQHELRPYQPTLGHAAIEAGASLVIGHHPHVLQGIERYRNGVIVYSLGNFAFGSFNPIGARGGLVRATFEGSCLDDIELIPLNTKNVEVIFQPTPLAGSEADAVVRQLQEWSTPLATPLENRGGKAGLHLNCAARP